MPDQPKQRSAPAPTSGVQPELDDRERARTAAKPAGAFDLWLERGLHKLFDDVAREPVPEALLKIIEQDRTKS